jgi:hypothetical protein
VRLPESIDVLKPRVIQKIDNPNSPYTIEGTPERAVIDVSTIFEKKPFPAYSERNTPVKTPRGIATARLNSSTDTEPIIAGNIPPFVIPICGNWVKNSGEKYIKPSSMKVRNIAITIANAA